MKATYTFPVYELVMQFISVWMNSVAPPMGEVLFCFPKYQCQDSWLSPKMNKQRKPDIHKTRQLDSCSTLYYNETLFNK